MKRFPPTEDHSHPQLEDPRHQAPYLVCAYPRSLALPFPFSAKPVGREWLDSCGLQDAQVSTSHASFSRPGGTLFVTDANSRNGTWINGVRAPAGERVALPEGSLLRIGNSLFVVREAFAGSGDPSPPIGSMVGPFGLREVRQSLDILTRQRPKTVLIEGETGTGKELAAAAVAFALGRSEPFVAINVAAIAHGVFDAQLFGYVRGAYSGAGAGAKGVFLAHEGGAVFLDEIGELPIDVQPKLLRLLQSREVMPVGAERPRTVDVLVIAATNRVLETMVAAGGFRRDLLARLAEARLELPPLRERPEDLWAISCALLMKHGWEPSSIRVEVEAIERLMVHDWPGNVRELQAKVETALCADRESALLRRHVDTVLGPAPILRTALTRSTAAQAIANAGGNETQAARSLGVSRGRLRRFLASAPQ